MNRFSPLIVRQPRRHPARAFAQWDAPAGGEKSKLAEDVQLFLTGWAGGFVFFGTLLL